MRHLVARGTTPALRRLGRRPALKCPAPLTTTVLEGLPARPRPRRLLRNELSGSRASSPRPRRRNASTGCILHAPPCKLRRRPHVGVSPSSVAYSAAPVDAPRAVLAGASGRASPPRFFAHRSESKWHPSFVDLLSSSLQCCWPGWSRRTPHSLSWRSSADSFRTRRELRSSAPGWNSSVARRSPDRR